MSFLFVADLRVQCLECSAVGRVARKDGPAQPGLPVNERRVWTQPERQERSGIKDQGTPFSRHGVSAMPDHPVLPSLCSLPRSGIVETLIWPI